MSNPAEAESVAAEFNRCVLQAIYAERNQNWDEAIRLWTLAQGLIAASPNFEKDTLSTEWDRNSIAAHIIEVRRLRFEFLGGDQLQRIPVEYVRPDCTTDCYRNC